MKSTPRKKSKICHELKEILSKELQEWRENQLQESTAFEEVEFLTYSWNDH